MRGAPAPTMRGVAVTGKTVVEDHAKRPAKYANLEDRWGLRTWPSAGSLGPLPPP
jgi:hypothetical protein